MFCYFIRFVVNSSVFFNFLCSFLTCIFHACFFNFFGFSGSLLPPPCGRPCLYQGFPIFLVPRTHFCESSLPRTPLLSCVNFSPNCYKSIKCNTKVLNCSFIFTDAYKSHERDGWGCFSQLLFQMFVRKLYI